MPSRDILCDETLNSIVGKLPRREERLLELLFCEKLSAPEAAEKLNNESQYNNFTVARIYQLRDRACRRIARQIYVRRTVIATVDDSDA